MSDDDFERFRVPEPLRERQGDVIVAALREAGYLAERRRHPKHDRIMVRHNAPKAAFVRARNLAQRLNGLPEFPDPDAFSAYCAWLQRNDA